jgi:hypothetical protein
MRTVVVLIIAAIHALYFASVVTKAGVKKAAQKYGRELILSTETLMAGREFMPFLESQKKRRNDSETEGRLRGALLLERFNALAGDDAVSVLRADAPPYSSIIALSCTSSSPAFIQQSQELGQ